jgi:drug/metabolite transporter (DMT)-like permease
MAVLNGIASGGEVAFSKKLSDKYSPLYLTTLSWLIIAATSLPLSLALGESQVPPALTLPWLFLICYAISSLLAFWTVILGVRYLEASIGGLIGLLEIVFSIAFGVLFFGESISGRIAIGGALIIFAAALPNLADLLSRPPPRRRDVA